MVIVLAMAALLAFPETDEFERAEIPVTSLSRSPLVANETLRAAEAGDADAQFKVGRSLLYDAISDKEKALEAVHWLQLAADNGNTPAMVHLGRMYRSGIGALQNFDLSAQWIQRSAEKGDAEGMLEIGRLYRDGIGVEPDLIKAYVWLNRAAARLNMEAARERESVMRRLDPDDLKSAQRLSVEIEPGGIIGATLLE